MECNPRMRFPVFWYNQRIKFWRVATSLLSSNAGYINDFRLMVSARITCLYRNKKSYTLCLGHRRTVSWTQLQNLKEKHAIPLGGFVLLMLYFAKISAYHCIGSNIRKISAGKSERIWKQATIR